MNYIELLNRFYDLLQANRISNNAQLLYYTLLQINNRCSWTIWFQRTNVNLSGMMCISEKALVNARNELKQLGLIDFITSKKRGECTKYSILYRTKDGTKEVQKKYKGSTKEVQSADINKPKPKLKEKETKKKVYVEDEKVNKAILDFIADREEREKKPMTERAISMFVKKLTGLSVNSDDQIAMINNAIEKGWKSVYPLNGNAKPSGKKDTFNFEQRTYDYGDLLSKIRDADQKEG